ncbi:hypothetical protein THAOC_06573, partial [Thalassiosira oceanica]
SLSLSLFSLSLSLSLSPAILSNHKTKPKGQVTVINDTLSRQPTRARTDLAHALKFGTKELPKGEAVKYPHRGGGALSGYCPTSPLGLASSHGALRWRKRHPVGLGQLGRHNDDREIFASLRLCNWLSSLHRDHANLLCILKRNVLSFSGQDMTSCRMRTP